MARVISKRFLAIILLMLFISALYSFPSAHAAESSVEQKGISILGNVAAFDLAHYTVTSKQQSQKYLYLNNMQEDVVSYVLESQNSKLNVSFTFAKDKLHILHVLESEGSPILTKTSTSIRDMAQDYLDDYAAYTKDSLYIELSIMLDGVDASKNSTVNSGNLKLQVNATADGYRTFSWIYSFNGVDAAEKCVALGYKNGALKYFVDTWSLYSIGSTAINLSEEEAIAVAMQSAKSFSYKVGSGDKEVIVKDFNLTRAMVTQLVFCDSVGAYNIRGDDVLVLYPMWRIGVGLDKWYPGNVYGIYVDIWADTGEIRLVHEVFSTLPPELVGSGLFDNSAAEISGSQALDSIVQSNSVPLLWLMFASLALGVFVAIPVWLRLKKGSLHLYDLRKRPFSKFTVGLLCFMLFSVVLLAPISMVNADTKRATIFGNREFNKTENEQYYQDAIADDITGMFADGGYSAINCQGSQGGGTVKTNILAKIGYGEQYYDKAAVVYFDHGIGNWVSEDYGNWHYSVYDNDEVQVFDMDIYDQTQGKTFFAFINTCMSANMTYGQGHYESGTALGMPYAFTHNLVGDDMSDNGYDDPWGDPCFIGFPWGSASLEQSVDPNLPSRLYWMWVYSFFWYALKTDMSVNSALDSASLMIFYGSFGGTDLRTGFEPYWGEPWGRVDSFMAVYGNGNLKLSPTWLEVSSWFHFYETWLEGNAPVYVDGNLAGSTAYSNHLRVPLEQGYHTVAVDSEHGGMPFKCFDGYPEEENPVNVYVEGGTTTYLAACYMPKHCLSIYSGTGGYADPTGNQYYFDDTYAEVTAHANANYTFAYWVLDGQSGGSNPTINVLMDTDHTLGAVFSYTGSQYCLSISSGTGGSTSPTGTQWYNHEDYPQVTADPDETYEFDHWLLDSQNAGSNPTIYVYMDDDHSLQAVFKQYCWLTVDAEDQYYNYVPAWVSIDSGQWTGTAGDSFYVPVDWHYIEVDDYYFYFYIIDSNEYFDNPVYVQVYSGMEVMAIYWSP